MVRFRRQGQRKREERSVLDFVPRSKTRSEAGEENESGSDVHLSAYHGVRDGRGES